MSAKHWITDIVYRLTSRDNNPDEIHEEIVAPEIVGFRATIRKPLVVVVKHARRVVQNIAVDLPNTHYRRKGVAQRVFSGDEPCDDERQRSPHRLGCIISNGPS